MNKTNQKAKKAQEKWEKNFSEINKKKRRSIEKQCETKIKEEQ